MISRTTLIWLNRVLWTVPIAAVLALGLLVSLGRYYIPFVEAHRQELVAEFQQRTGLRISIGRLQGRWQHIAPHFVVEDLRLYNPKQPSQAVLHIRRAELQLGVFRSIQARTLAISRLRGEGVRVQLEEAGRGRWQLPGFEPKGANSETVLDTLMAVYGAELADTSIDLRFADGAAARINASTLKLQRARDFRRINLAMTLGQQQQPFTLVLEAQGDPRHQETFSARGHAAFKGVDLTPVLPAAEAFGIDLHHGLVDGAAWLEWRGGRGLEVRAELALPQLDLAGFNASLAPATDIKTRFLLRAGNGRYEVWIPQLSGACRAGAAAARPGRLQCLAGAGHRYQDPLSAARRQRPL